MTIFQTPFDILAQAEGQTGQNPLGVLLPVLLIFGAMYFLLIAPQRKRQKQHEQMLGNLKQGDKVVSAGGIHGTVMSVKDDKVTVRVAENVQMVFSKPSIAQLANETTQAEAVKKA